MGTEETCYFCVCCVTHTHTRAPLYSAQVLKTWRFSAIFLYGIAIKHTELG